MKVNSGNSQWIFALLVIRKEARMVSELSFTILKAIHVAN